jgi:hypothetical protein
MIIPLTLFAHDLSWQRRIDAHFCLEFNLLTTSEVEKIESGLLKYNIMWWANKMGFCAFFIILVKGRLLDRGGITSLSISRSVALFFLGTEYLYLGDLMAGSLLWEEYKYIYYKYEPQIRKKKFKIYPHFLRDSK